MKFWLHLQKMVTDYFSLTALLFFSSSVRTEAVEAAGLQMDIMFTTYCIVNDAVTHQANR